MNEVVAVIMLVAGACAAFAASEVVRELERRSDQMVEGSHE